MWATTTKDNHFLLTVGSTDIKLVLAQDENGMLMLKRYLGAAFIQRTVNREDISFAASPLEDEPIDAQGTWHLGLGAYSSTDAINFTNLEGRYFFADGVDASTPGVLHVQQDETDSTYVGSAILAAPTLVADYANNVYVASASNLGYTSDAGLNFTNIGTLSAKITAMVTHNNLLYIAPSGGTYYYTNTPGTLTNTGHLTTSTGTGDDAKATLFVTVEDCKTGQSTLFKFLNPNKMQFSDDGTNGGTAWSTEEFVGEGGVGTGADTFIAAKPFQDGILIFKTRDIYFRNDQGETCKVAGPFPGTFTQHLVVVHPGNGKAYAVIDGAKIIEVSKQGNDFVIIERTPKLYGPRVKFLNGGIAGLDADTTWLYVIIQNGTAYPVLKGRFYTEEEGAPWVWHGSFLKRQRREEIVHPVILNGTPYLMVFGAIAVGGRRVLNWPDPLLQGGNFETGAMNFWTSHVDFGMRNIPKLARRYRAETENLSSSNTISFTYYADSDAANTGGAGTAFGTTHTADPSSAYSGEDNFPLDLDFRRMQTKLVLTNATAGTPIKVYGLVLYAALRPQRRVVWDMYCRMDQDTMLIGGTLNPTNVEGVYNQFFDPDSSTGIIYDTSNTFILTESMFAADKFAVEIDTAEVVFVKDMHGEPQAVLHLVLKEIKGATS